MKPRWYADPKLARTLSRASWVVIVAGLVLLTRFPLGDAEPFALLGFVAAVLAMNGPVIYGLSISGGDSGTKAYRAVTVALLARIGAAAFVVWVVSTR